MIDIEELIYSQPKIKDLSIKEMSEYDRFMRYSIGQLIDEGIIQESDIILLAETFANAFFKMVEEVRREKSKIAKKPQ